MVSIQYIIFKQNSKAEMFFISETRKRRKEIHKLNNNKASQHFDIPTKIIKNSPDIFRDFL